MGYPSGVPIVKSYATLKISKEEVGDRSSIFDFQALGDQVHIYVNQTHQRTRLGVPIRVEGQADFTVCSSQLLLGLRAS
jgi:hypothetical protein